MSIWEAVSSVPQEYAKPITAGKLKGMSNINPQWRLLVLTQMFGAVGFGWNVREVERWTNEAGGEIGCFVKVALKVKVAGEWSEDIEGVGGSKLYGKGHGNELNDEGWKMAYTDAISVACKSLGIAADTYLGKDADYGTKYEDRMYNGQQQSNRPAPAPQAAPTAAPAPKKQVSSAQVAAPKKQVTEQVIKSGQGQPLVTWLLKKASPSDLPAWSVAAKKLRDMYEWQGNAFNLLLIEAEKQANFQDAERQANLQNA